MAIVLMIPSLSFAANDLGSLNEALQTGQTLSVGLNPSSTGNWHVVGTTDSTIATATVTDNALVIRGKKAGTVTFSACVDQQGSSCLSVTVTVTGNVLGSSITLPHPLKSWVLHKGTVFYIHANGLIPISTWNIFLSNGGKSSLIKVANSGDLNFPLLFPIMEIKDYRVK